MQNLNARPKRGPGPRLPQPTTVLRWEEPPPNRRNWRRTIAIKRIRELQLAPGTWALVCLSSSQGAAQTLRKAATRIGARVEVCTRINEDQGNSRQRWRVYARALTSEDDFADED